MHKKSKSIQIKKKQNHKLLIDKEKCKAEHSISCVIIIFSFFMHFSTVYKYKYKLNIKSMNSKVNANFKKISNRLLY